MTMLCSIALRNVTIMFEMLDYLRLNSSPSTTCNLEFRLRHSQIQARTRLNRLLGARMDGSAAIVTSLGRARARARDRLGLGLRVGQDALIFNDVMPIPRLPVTCPSYPAMT